MSHVHSCDSFSFMYVMSSICHPCVHILKLINIIVSLPRFSCFRLFCLVDISYPVDNFDLFICSGYFVIVLN